MEIVRAIDGSVKALTPHTIKPTWRRHPWRRPVMAERSGRTPISGLSYGKALCHLTWLRPKTIFYCSVLYISVMTGTTWLRLQRRWWWYIGWADRRWRYNNIRAVTRGCFFGVKSFLTAAISTHALCMHFLIGSNTRSSKSQLGDI